MKRGARRQEEEEILQQEEERRKLGFVKESSDDEFGKGNGLKVKIVLTRQELEWLMLQLEDKEGKKLEDVLGEIGKGRTKIEAWRPSLESIIECPEVLEMDK